MQRAVRYAAGRPHSASTKPVQRGPLSLCGAGLLSTATRGLSLEGSLRRGPKYQGPHTRSASDCSACTPGRTALSAAKNHPTMPCPPSYVKTSTA
ncbi:hypothetical protein SKAU_G00068180 [Synaphobranchus kaupii]|uniref:Uncharacterized protein n=1 Tax=Synaphobranchus kaupii TaxID=118154 RepID=A0A9Q1G672_SYNKA|nr:hypothetical protein SKAU_G00068180 [Synaphobranchus kaupii]